MDWGHIRFGMTLRIRLLATLGVELLYMAGSRWAKAATPDLTTAELVLTALQETPSSVYTLVFNDATGERRVSGDRTSTEAALGQLRDAGGHWRLFARAATPDDAPTPASPGGA